MLKNKSSCDNFICCDRVNVFLHGGMRSLAGEGPFEQSGKGRFPFWVAIGYAGAHDHTLLV